MAELVKIKFLRGTKSQVDAATNEAGKPYFATDTKEIFISDGVTKHLIGKVEVNVIASRPSAAVEGRVFVATDENNKLYVDTGTAWVASGITDLADLSGDLDDITDGTTYGKVKNTELDNGQVKQIRAVTGLTDISGDDIKTHLDDDDKHREINDSGTGTEELWSANKINAEVNSISAGQVRRKAVINYVDSTAIPLTEISGDRYLLDFTAGTVHANWDGANKGDIVEFNGTTWDNYTPEEGWILYVDDEDQDRAYVDDGTPDWEARPVAIVNHNDLNGLNTGSFHHLSLQEKKEATQIAGTDNEAGLMSDADKDKLDGIETGAEVNQDITCQNGVTRTDTNGANEDAVIEGDFGIDADIQNVAIVGTNDVGDNNKLCHANHTHVLVEVDGGTL